ncbi:MAG: PDZ domain-containing protein [Magnetococcales bacterium]|nr:PDZ domain-containing protein [Magnetococcales bacterium]
MRLTGSMIVAVGLVVVLAGLVSALFISPDYDQLPEASTAQTPAVMGGGTASAISPAGLGQTVAFNRGEMMVARPMKNAPPLKPFIAKEVQLSEAHWQGLEAIPLSSEIKKKLKLPAKLEGLLIDEVSLNAALSGLLAADILMVVNATRVKSLDDLLEVSKRVQARRSVAMTVYRKGVQKIFVMSAEDNLGYAQVETAPMILPGEIMPHPYRGPCTRCHTVGTTGHMVPDPDGIILPPPPISVDAPRPHQDRGPCKACHVMITN